MNLPARIERNPVPVKAPNDIPLGSAAWQRPGESAVGPFAYGDFFLGFDPNGAALGVADDLHSIVTAGTRGGKGVSIIAQNLVLWPGSALVIDPKGENAMVFARRRGNGSRYAQGMNQKVRILDPFDTVHTAQDSFADLKACFNPLDMLRPDREESVDDAARIADALIVGDDPFWDNSARIAVKGIILHVASAASFTPGDRNLNTVRKLIMEGDAKGHALAVMAHGKKASSAFQLLFAAMKKNAAFDGVVASVGGMLDDLERTAARTLGGIMQTVRSNTEFLDSPAMKRCVARSDFSLKELKTNPCGMSLFICLPQRFVETHFRWLRMMVTLGITEMEQTRSMPACGHRVLMVLDEFPALRRMRVIENAAAQIAGFGVKLMFVAQTLAQLKDLYQDNWETLLANAGVKMFFCNDDNFTREYASKLVGDCEVTRTTRNSSNTVGNSKTVTLGATVGFSESMTLGSSTGSKAGSNSYSSSRTVGTSQSFSASTGTTESYSQTEGTSENVHRRALITPDEVGRLFGSRDDPAALALISGHQPLFLHRRYYFRDLDMAGFFDPHPDHPLPLTVDQARFQRSERERLRIENARKAQADALARRLAREEAEALRDEEMLLRNRKETEAMERRWMERERVLDKYRRSVEVAAIALLMLFTYC